LPNSQAGGFFSNLVQAASQASSPPVPSAQSPVAPAPIPPAGPYRPAPTRTSAPPASSARPEAAAGLDGWLVDRLFGR
jgi:penicillin-binding protein 1A